MRYKFIKLCLSLLAFIALSFAAFAELTIGFSQVGAANSWRVAETSSMKKEAEKRGYTLKFSDAQNKQENQIKAIRSFIAQGVDAIILAPQVETGWDRVLKEAKKANIPVILVDRGVNADESLYTTLIASDFVFEARLAAAWLAQYTSGRANIVELQGTLGAAPSIDRQNGFAEVIDMFPDMSITQSQTGDFTRTKGKEVMEAFLKADDSIDAIYAHNDDMAIGAIQAIKEAGLKPSEDIIVVSIDGVKDAFVAMVNGELNATVECNPLLGPMAFDAIEAALKGEKLPKKMIQIDRIFTKDVAANVIDQREY